MVSRIEPQLIKNLNKTLQMKTSWRGFFFFFFFPSKCPREGVLVMTSSRQGDMSLEESSLFFMKEEV